MITNVSFEEFKRILTKRKKIIKDMLNQTNNKFFINIAINKFDKEHFGVVGKDFKKLIKYFFREDCFELLLKKKLKNVKMIYGWETENNCIILNGKEYEFKEKKEISFNYVYTPNYDKTWDELLKDYPEIEEILWQIPIKATTLVESGKIREYNNVINKINKEIKILENETLNEENQEKIKNLKNQNEAVKRLKKNESLKMKSFNVSEITEFLKTLN